MSVNLTTRISAIYRGLARKTGANAANGLAFVGKTYRGPIRRFLADETSGGSLTCWEAFKRYGWAMVPLLVANELRGLYVVMEVMGYA